MFTQSLSILTCLAMLWHSLGGCCWHHDHFECDGEGISNGITVCDHSPEHCSHDHAKQTETLDHGENSQDSIPCDHSKHCGAVDCVYVKTISPDLSFLLPNLGLYAQSVPDELFVSYDGEIFTSEREVFCLRGKSSSQQHCALYQSWLL